MFVCNQRTNRPSVGEIACVGPSQDEQMGKRNLRVSALAEGLSAIGLVLAIVTVISPYWGRFSNEGSPNSGGNVFPDYTTYHRSFPVSSCVCVVLCLFGTPVSVRFFFPPSSSSYALAIWSHGKVRRRKKEKTNNITRVLSVRWDLPTANRGESLWERRRDIERERE